MAKYIGVTTSLSSRYANITNYIHWLLQQTSHFIPFDLCTKVTNTFGLCSLLKLINSDTMTLNKARNSSIISNLMMNEQNSVRF